MIVSCSEEERRTLDVPLQRTFTGPHSVLSDDIASIPRKDQDPPGLLERMNFHLCMDRCDFGIFVQFHATYLFVMLDDKR
jgi:hypothetical protein